MNIVSLIIAGFSILMSVAGVACAVILPIVIIGVVGYILYKRSQQSNMARQAAQSWPSTTGTVLTSTIQVSHTGRSRAETPVAIYTYEVNGQSYQGQTIKAGDQYMSVRFSGDAINTMGRYPVGKKVSVYYNPTNPAESALER